MSLQEIATVEPKQWEGHVIDGRFHLRQYLGGSPRSAVFLTEFGEGTPRQAAIKLMLADVRQAAAWMVRREISARLSHPGLLPLLRFGTGGIDGMGLVYAVMELSDEDLSQVIPVRALAPEEAREVLVAAVETLRYLHGQGFAHGRLTPSNIMAAGNRVKLSTDGLVRIGEPCDPLRGPAPLQPPESRAGLTPASDVWWLGMTLVEMLTQRAPVWDGRGAADPAVPETLGAPFLEIARGCLRADAGRRWALAAIGPALQATAAAASAPAKKKRKRLLPVLGAAVAGSVAIAALVYGLKPASHPAETTTAAAPSGEILPSESQPPAPAPTPKPTPEPTPAPVTTPAPVPAVTKPAPPPAVSKPAVTKPVPTPAAPAGNVGERVLPQVPSGYFATISGAFTVRVRVKVDASGAVTAAELASPAVSKYFDRVSVETARRWRFAPGSDGATHVVRFEYRRDGCSASAE